MLILGTGNPGQAQNIYNSAEGEAWKRSSKPVSMSALGAVHCETRGRFFRASGIEAGCLPEMGTGGGQR